MNGMKTEEYRARIFQSYAAAEGSFFSAATEEDLVRYESAYRRRVLRFFPSDKNASIVDLACGNGKFIYFILKQGYTNVLGVDINPNVVAAARKVTPNIVCEDALNFLRNHKCAFEMIVALDFLEHIHKKDIFNLIDGIHTSLKPGGIVLFRTPCADNPYGVSARYNDFTHEIGLTSGCMRSLLAVAGFKDISVYPDGPAPGNFLQTLQWLVFNCYAMLARLQRWVLALGGGRDVILTPNMWIVARSTNS